MESLGSSSHPQFLQNTGKTIFELENSYITVFNFKNNNNLNSKNEHYYGLLWLCLILLAPGLLG